MKIVIDKIDLTPCEQAFKFDSSEMLRVVYAGARGMLKYVPMDTGFLRGNAYASAPDTYTYGANYAIYVYNMHGVNWTTPDTDGEWIKRYDDSGAPEVCEEAARIVSEKG